MAKMTKWKSIFFQFILDYFLDFLKMNTKNLIAKLCDFIYIIFLIKYIKNIN